MFNFNDLLSKPTTNIEGFLFNSTQKKKWNSISKIKTDKNH
jgi:hypothetical protein